MKRKLPKVLRKNLTILPTLLIAIAFGMLLQTGIQLVYAQTSSDFINACVGTGVLNQGRVRIPSNGNCQANEDPITWAKAPGNNGLPFTCGGCTLGVNEDLGNRLRGKNLTGAYLSGSTLNSPDLTNTNFTNSNFHQTRLGGALLDGTNFTGADLYAIDIGSSTGNNTNFNDTDGPIYINNSNINNATFVNANIDASSFNASVLTNADFTNANVTGVQFIDSNIEGSNATNANFQTDSNVTIFTNANLTNVNFTNANLTGAVDMDTSTLTGITWSNTICPDGTNSNSNGNTCIGHLTP